MIERADIILLMLEEKKVAIVYDWIDKWGGVERVLLMLHEMFPKADFFTSYFDEKKAEWAKKLNIQTSFIQNLPAFIKKSRILSLPFYPYAFESFNFSKYDLVISVTSSFAKAVITQPKTFHLCYLLTPTRYLWSHEKDYLKRYMLGVRSYVEKLKNWDNIAAQRPDKIISISKAVADRCRKYYGRESEVICPPFDLGHWQKIKSKFQNPNDKSNPKSKIFSNFFLVVARLELYKKVDLVIRVFNQLTRLRSYQSYYLIIVGEGMEEARLKTMAGKNIYFRSKISDIELAKLYIQAQALIMPQEEDFGYAALEAQFFGCPVIAYEKGGAKETVINGKTGLFFNEQTKKSLSAAIERFKTISYNLKKRSLLYGKRNVEKFSRIEFVKRFEAIIMSNVKS